MLKHLSHLVLGGYIILFPHFSNNPDFPAVMFNMSAHGLHYEMETKSKKTPKGFYQQFMSFYFYVACYSFR